MSQLDRLAILGRQPEFGLVELESRLGSQAVQPFGPAALVSQPPPLEQLGGTVKLGRVLRRQPLSSLAELDLTSLELPYRDSKVVFGVSVYGLHISPAEVTALGQRLKQQLGSARYIRPMSGAQLNAAQLKFNHVLDKGFELLIVADRRELVLALTESFQDIDAYAARDHGRPSRSASVGMLPPKLAQILVNTTQAQMIVDPFCGTGVILQEALLMGRAAHGSDVAPAMVEASQTNLEWLGSQHQLPDWKVEPADARQVKLTAGAAIVSEGYLGPNLSHSPAATALPEIISPLLQLYREALTNWANQLAFGTEVSLCAPVWRVDGRWQPLPIVDELTDLGYTMKVFSTAHGPFIYGRPDQTVGRMLLLLTKR